MRRLEKFIKMAMSQDSHFRLTIGMAFVLLSTVIGATIYITDIKNNVSNNTVSIDEVEVDIDTLQNDNTVLKVTVAEINLKLLTLNKGQDDLNTGQKEVIRLLINGN